MDRDRDESVDKSDSDDLREPLLGKYGHEQLEVIFNSLCNLCDVDFSLHTNLFLWFCVFFVCMFELCLLCC